jgi:hypothetical protein
LIAEPRNGDAGQRQGPRYANASKRRAPPLVGVALSVLIHALGLWFLFYLAPVVKPLSISSERHLTVSLLPPSSQAQSQSKAQVPASAQPKGDSATQSPGRPPAHRAEPPKKQIRKPLIARNTAPANTPQATPSAPSPGSSQDKMSIPDDMSTQLEAARKRRADALSKEQAANGSSEQSEARHDNSIALANIAESLKHGKGNAQDDSGGIFSIRHLGYHDAEFMFYGWNANSRRSSSRLVVVEQGTEADIHIAIVKKMIEIIREQKQDEFVWKSDRLGKDITLSARPEYNGELEQFLMREFFEENVPPARR